MIFPFSLAHFYLIEAKPDLLATVQARHRDSENVSFEGLPKDLSEDFRAQTGIFTGTTAAECEGNSTITNFLPGVQCIFDKY